MLKNEFGQFLKEYMEKHEYKLEAFADKVGYSFGLIGHYINGRRSPSYKFINAFFTKFKLSEEEKIKILEILKKDKLPREIQQLINDLEKTRSNVNFDNTYELIEIPVYSSISAGFGYVSDSFPTEYASIPKIEGDVIGIRVSGDSMEKTIYNGDIVVVKKDVEVNVGDIGVFLLNKEFGDGVVKRLAKKNGMFVLESDNPYYKPIEIKTSEIISCGKVIKIIKNTTLKQKDKFSEMFNSLSAQQQQELLNFAEFLKKK